MAKIDEVKEYIGFLKAVFIAILLVDFSMIAYLYNKSIDGNILVIVGIIFISYFVLFLFGIILKEIKSLKDL